MDLYRITLYVDERSYVSYQRAGSAIEARNKAMKQALLEGWCEKFDKEIKWDCRLIKE